MQFSHTHTQTHKYTEHRLRGRDRDVTLCSQNTLLWSGQKQQADRWGLCRGGRGELCVAAAAAAAAAASAHNMCLCAHVVCCAYAYVHACMSERVCAPICECVCLHVRVLCCGGGGGGGGLMGQLCVCPICHPTLLTPRGTAGRVGGGDSFWKKESGVQRSNGQQCRSYWRARGKGHRLGVWKPIYQSIWQNSGPPLSGSASVCLIRHAHPWNYASNEKGVHCILRTHTHTQTMHAPGANVSLMHGHAVARGLIGYINTNTSLERREGKSEFVL